MNPASNRLRDPAKDTVAGGVASIAMIANVVSFGAQMFPGDLASGAPVAIWAMLIGSCIGGVWIALERSTNFAIKARLMSYRLCGASVHPTP